MRFWAGLKRQLRALVAPSVFLALVGYFGWNATQGERGLNAYAMRQEQLKSVEAELVRVNRLGRARGTNNSPHCRVCPNYQLVNLVGPDNDHKPVERQPALSRHK